MKKYIFFSLALLLFILLVFNADVQAQCAMCKAVVTSNMEGESKVVGKGLNNAILYLMSIPYLVLAGLGYMFYRNWKAAK